MSTLQQEKSTIFDNGKQLTVSNYQPNVFIHVSNYLNRFFYRYRKSKTASFAELELQILCELYPDKNNSPIIKEFIPEILKLVNKFGKSGQSGGSAPYTAVVIADAVKKLCLQKPISPITGSPQEWGNPFGIPESSTIQNKRCYALFKQADGRSCYSDAILWKTQTGGTWHTTGVKLPSGGTIGNSQYIKGFPFTPKTFTIDVIETEVRPDDWEFTVKDESQLNQVWEYYNKKINN